MNVEVKLFAYFRDNRFKRKICSLDGGSTVGQVIHQLNIDEEEVGVIMINGRHCQSETVLTDGDSLGIFPMIGGG